MTDRVASTKKESLVRSSLSIVWLAVAGIGTLAWCYGQFIRDRSIYEALCFYIPSPLLAGWCLAGIVASFWRRRWRRCLIYCVLVLPPAIYIGAIENHWRTVEPFESPDRIRLVHWNVCHGAGGWADQKQRLLSFDADIIVITEPASVATADDFPGYSVSQVRQLLIAVKGRHSISDSLVPGGALHAFLVTCQLPNGRLRLMVADMSSRILLSRDLYLHPLMSASSKFDADVIVGDLNAPRRSLALTDQQYPFQHAYDAAGGGWGYTWPMPFPMLSLDQCLFGAHVEAISYNLHSTMESDHRLQCFDFRRRESADRSDISAPTRPQ